MFPTIYYYYHKHKNQTYDIILDVDTGRLISLFSRKKGVSEIFKWG